MGKASSKIVLIGFVILAISAFFYFDLARFLTLDFLNNNIDAQRAYFEAQPVLVVSLYMLIYVTATALSLPGAVILTLAGGAIFGLGLGTLLVSFASTIGATLAFLASRFILRSSVQAKFGDRLQAINQGIEREGAFYLFALRLVPAFPFFVINLVMGLTPLPVRTFFWVSHVGMLAGTVVYVNAGAQIAQTRLDSLAGILSPGLIGSFVLLGLFPLIAKKLLPLLRKRFGG